MTAERKIAHELAEKMADDRAHRIASTAAEELIRCEGEATSGIDEFAIPQCQADDHTRDCIAHLRWHAVAVFRALVRSLQLYSTESATK